MNFKLVSFFTYIELKTKHWAKRLGHNVQGRKERNVHKPHSLSMRQRVVLLVYVLFINDFCQFVFRGFVGMTE